MVMDKTEDNYDSRQERENGIAGTDTRKLLEEMKKIVLDAEARDANIESEEAR